MHRSKAVIYKTLFLCAVLFSVFENSAQKQKGVEADTNSVVSVRTPEKIQDFLNDDAFLYDTKKAAPPQTFFQKIRHRILSLINSFFYLTEKGGNIVAYIFYGLMLFLLVFVILKLAGLSPYNLIIRPKKIKRQDILVFEEDIKTTDFDKIISEAQRKGDFRKAVRFLYIKLLKLLADKEFVEWKKEKTNKDYKQEMQKNRYSKEFSELTKIYEYVWYGEFDINQDFFNLIYSDYNKLYKRLYE